MRIRSLGLVLFAAALSTAAAAQVYRCTDARGAVTYQERTCPPTSDERATAIPTAYPEVNMRERDRLLARADAADARLLKRLEIEAAERIARDHRAAMEAAASAERAQAAESSPVMIVAFPAARHMRVHRPPHRPISFQ